MIKQTIMLIGICVFLSTAAQAQDAPEEPKTFQKFTVYEDKPSRNHFVASGFMPYGDCVAVNDAWQEGCQQGRSCIKSDYDRDCSTLSSGWAGVYWLHPANNWGDKKGFDLTGATRLVFWARGEKGGETVVFKMGGVGVGREHPDSAVAEMEPITLTSDWKEYSIDLSGKDMYNIVGGFAWVGTAKENQSNITFYIDNIYYE